MTEVLQCTQGQTPHDRLSYLINRLCDELDSAQSSASKSRDALSLAQHAKAVIDGYDNYLQKTSSPHPAVVDTMIEAGNKEDWDAVHREGKTMFKLMPEMSAGGYEAVVLQHLAKISKVCMYRRGSYDRT